MTTWTVLLAGIHVCNILAIISVIFFQRKESPTRFAWILVLVFIPVGGFFLYLLFGHSYVRRERFKFSESAVKEIHTYLETKLEQADSLAMDKRYVQMVRLNLVNDEAPLTDDNRVRVYTNGAEKFRDMMRDIEAAEKHIHMLYFIFRTDELGESILDLLAKKASLGVDVKVVYDDMGNVAVSGRGFRKLREAGGRVFRYSPLLTSFVSANYRNHRKLVIIDGKVGYIGGMNVGLEYVKGKKKLVPWRDTHIRLEGSAVRLMEGVFIGDYLYAAKEQDRVDDARRFFPPGGESAGKSAVQIVTSAPENGRYHVHDAYSKMIASAEKYLYIQTPYLVPDRTIMDGLRIAATSGVDVRIMLPEIPDKFLVYCASLDYARVLCGQGVKIYLHKGFLHSKMLLADDQVVSIGSANLDLRSFFLSFEANAFIYDPQVVADQREQFFRDIENSRPVDKEFFAGLSPVTRLLMPVCHLFSPLL